MLAKSSWPSTRANPVAPIEILARLALVEGHLRADHHRALQIRDVVALDPLGRVAQMELGAQVVEHLLARLLVVAARGETLARILHRHFEQAQLVAALRHRRLDLLAAPLGEQLGAHLGVFELDRHDDLVGDVARARVILRQQVGEHILVGEFEVLKTPAMRAGQLAAAHHQHDRLDKAALAIKPEDILIDSPMMQHGLPLDGLFDRAHAVAHPRRLFEFEPLGMAFICSRISLQQLEVLALQQHLSRRADGARYSSRSTGRQHGPRHRLI